MSWIQKNYEKALIGAAAVAALALGYFGWSAGSNVAETFTKPATGGGNSKTGVAEAELVPGATSNLASPHQWQQTMEDERPLDLFTGPPLFAMRDSKGVYDLWKGDPVHPPIPNRWWLKYHLNLTYADSAQRDEDGDGYSALEEFQAGTDPSDPKSHPELIQKLSYVKDKSLTWFLRPGFEVNGGFTFKYQDSLHRTNKASATAVVMPGQTFFAEEPMKGRFKLLGSEKKEEVNPRTKVPESKTYVQIEDSKPNKAGTKYLIPNNIIDAEAPKWYQHDRNAVFELRAAGFSGKEFEVEEHTPFALPPGGTDKKFLLKEVTPESVTLEWKDAEGKEHTARIPKGGLPEIQP